ncbi:flagellar basal body P-ring formation chaperone FlgA [Geoalkalibacter halelectricus]|uniref:Flagella basal body P-ring formation protein FlgA n=1 Tax=Geoalkalibacter halelectricus TaxID=2847045 RepID=A0ABY5ZK46_9BACT|nr:flagellar basal body P-ring formation chaperone FlgA [Geoalkalibacter halelectricus]MDO3378053.1 flagellar basal body P-ring formation chaperone FlgA [Geoalkalibacter halelectricus]UWZ78352.1 flagellar basal body P-ring formation chaperone FlgA [Geoalkalibacter halelectricus]
MKTLLTTLIVCLALLGAGAFAQPAAAKGTLIGPAQMRALLEDYLEDKRAFLPQGEVRIQSFDVRDAFTLPPGRVTHEIIPSDPQILTSRRFTFIFYVDGRIQHNQSYRVQLEAIAPVAVAAVDLSRGVMLTERDINFVEMDLARLRNPAFSAEDLVGKVLRRSMRLGDVLDRSFVEEPSLVRRGEVVTIIARRGALELNATGVARDEGKLGDTIRIRNSASQKEILCQVVAPATVRVEF